MHGRGGVLMVPHEALALFLLVNLAAALVRVARGPGPADRMLAALLFGTTGVAVVLLLATGEATARVFVDVALVLALLAAIAGIAFARHAWTAPREPPDAP
jgi:multicomponent Na+:H+ antiporter subunit F